MPKKFLKNALIALTLSAGLLTATNVDAAKSKPIVLETQGSYAVGGKTVKH